ncbi:RNA polymerase sigma-70 factor [Dactylosporangium sp. NBC_01737]|uniref:RNA polymerase sigma-70 factor n=1 Tax=Dactylosporangium sp. NBC_01737 TaxID=2975959 RepID=UPI002E0FAA77|nr:RNA polymerase sigma-70 factor [Dactylosporangium sp. NBC_01737]
MADLAIRHERLRPLVFAVAYRMLGSVADAEDITQEVLLRLLRHTAPVDSPDAYAVTVTTRLAIDHLRSARVRRELYVGTWLPEPMVSSDESANPAAIAEQDETLSLAFLATLERLSPVERAVFLLREVFDYDYDTIAGVVARNPANCRQILARARAHVRENRPRFEVSPARRDELARRFFSACHGGDLAALESLLADDVTFYADGNGRPPAVVAPVVGCTPVARFLLGLFRHADRTGLEVQPRAVNGQPGARVLDGRGRLRAVFALHIADGAIRAVHTVVNPDKLRHLHGR